MVELVGLVALALVAFAGGALGAAIGGLPAFSLAGLIIVVGEVAEITQQSVAAAGPVNPSALGATGLTASLGLGPGFGPHVAFAGGVAAAAYAARKGYMDTDFDYHEAKNVTYALGTEPDVLVVGGLFGVLGVAIVEGATAVGIPADPIALSIVLSAFVHRIVFGYPLVGKIRGGVLDMSPFERGERRSARPDGGTADDSAITPEGDQEPVGRFVVEPWLPHQYRWGSVALLGAVVGIFSAYTTYVTGSAFLAFGFTAASLIFLNLGMEKMPITHHMALPASILVVGLAGANDPTLLEAGATPGEISSTVTLSLAVVAGGAIGALAGLFGELAERVFYAHADTHLDPPAAAIVLSTLLIGVLEVVGVLSTGGILPMP